MDRHQTSSTSSSSTAKSSLRKPTIKLPPNSATNQAHNRTTSQALNMNGERFPESTGQGPTLVSRHDPIATSDQAFDVHLERVTRQNGPGPSLGVDHSPPDPARHGSIDWAANPLHNIHSGTTQRDSGPPIEQYNVVRRQTHAKIRGYIGLAPESSVIEHHHAHTHLLWSGIRNVLREPFAEFFGTFILVLFGDAAIAQALLSSGSTVAGNDGAGTFQNVAWCYGIGVMLGIYVAGDSGGFLNPGVTLAFTVYRRFPLRRFPIYLLAQVLGAFCAAGVVYANYIAAINNFEGGSGIRTVGLPTSTAGIFATYPAGDFLHKSNEFFSEFIASAILMFVIFALKDDTNPGCVGKSGAGKLFPLAMFMLFFGIGAAFGWETGFAINMARDFGPRLLTACVGYGSDVWSYGGYYFWVPFVAPFLGCLFGGGLYDVFIYTGPESPVNTPWMGLKGFVTGNWGSYGHDSHKGEDLENGTMTSPGGVVFRKGSI